MASDSSRRELALACIPKPNEQDQEITDSSDGETIDVSGERFPRRHEYENEIARLYEMLRNIRLEARGRYQDMSAAEVRCQGYMDRLKQWEKSLTNLEENLRGWNEFLKSRDCDLRYKKKDLKKLRRKLRYERQDLKDDQKKYDSWGKDLIRWEDDLNDWEDDLEDREERLKLRQGRVSYNERREKPESSRREYGRTRVRLEYQYRPKDRS
jgi:DNA repair exonuclease SbcCD ATPase subunit